ncbi:MAG: cytochrome C biogenesis protein [Gammaproteobacteria bacterium RIFCSPHIGHO2_12_FULL_63_22]|nr:MAG: cytochrome C biogenesis protein [Gammaproteobacteria bacterium RIFCSPHIGHO2_12_FULL_63_22]
MKQASMMVAALWLAVMAMVAPGSARAASEEDLLPVDQAYVLTAKAVSRERIEFSWTIAPGYYLYRHRFGVSAVDSSFKTNPLQIPDGKQHTDEFFGKVETYRNQVTLAQTGAAASGVGSVSFKVKYQGCADIGVCYPPQTRTLTVALPAAGAAGATDAANSAGLDGLLGAPSDPLAGLASGASALGVGDALPEEQAFRYEAIANSPSELLVRITPAQGYYLYRDKTSFQLLDAQGVTLGAPRWPAGKAHRDEHFGDVTVYFDVAEIPLPLIRSNEAAQTLTLQANFQGCQTDGICYRPMTRQLTIELPAGAGALVGAASAAMASTAANGIAAEAAPTHAPPGLLLSLLLALIGGLILNLMPCVLPVLSFKALGLAQASRSHAHAKAHALWYTAGVLASFAVIGALVLALRSAGQALGWGFQLQQPEVVAGLTMLMFAIGLSLSGVFQFGATMAGVGQSLTEKSGATGDFFTGVLAVIVASPCTAPFMAGALGYAFTAPVLPAMLVFLALGLGLALPFLLIGFVPALATRLPRPGAWMETLKHWLAFPMYLTAVWLLWVFGKQRGMDAVGVLLIAAVLLALGLWWLEKQRYTERPAQKVLAWILIAVAGAASIAAVRLPAQAAAQQVEQGTVAYSAKALAEERAAGRAVFIDMTADWCITCKVNEKAVLHTDAFRELLERTDTVYMVGDWTDQDAEISAFLDEFHAPGVPLYVVYPAGGGPGKKLPQLLSQSMMEEALDPAAKR